MGRVRINRKIVKIKEERKHYLSGNTLYAEGRTQGDVKAKRDFADDIYTQNQFDSHLELTIPLPTELIKLDDVDYDSIAKDLIKSLGLEDKYGFDNVAYYVHHRDETSGRTKNDNLHVHVCYVDRIIESDSELKLYQANKKPHGINLINGSNIKAGVFKEDSIHHFKIDDDTPKLDFSLVDEDTLEKFKTATSNGRKKKFDDDELNVVNELKKQIIDQAQSKSIGAIIYSNRYESKDIDKTQLKSITKEQRVAVAEVLNDIIDVYELHETKDKYGYFNANTKQQELEQREKELDERDKALDERESTLDNEKQAEVDGLKQDRIKIANDNAKVLSDLKEDQEKELDEREKELDEREADIPNKVKKQVDEQLVPLKLELTNEIATYKKKTKDIDQVVKTRAEEIASDYVEASKKLSVDASLSMTEVKQANALWQELEPKKRKEGLTGKAVDTYTADEINPIIDEFAKTINKLQRERISTQPLLNENNRLNKLTSTKGVDEVKKLNAKLIKKVTTQFVNDVFTLYRDWKKDRQQIRKKHDIYDKEIKPVYSDVLSYDTMEYNKNEVFIELGLMRREHVEKRESDNIIDVREAVRSVEIQIDYDDEPTR